MKKNKEEEGEEGKGRETGHQGKRSDKTKSLLWLNGGLLFRIERASKMRKLEELVAVNKAISGVLVRLEKTKNLAMLGVATCQLGNRRRTTRISQQPS